MNGRPPRSIAVRLAARHAWLSLVFSSTVLAAGPTPDAVPMTVPANDATRSAAEQKLATPLRVQVAAIESDRPNADTVTVEIDGTVTPALAEAIQAAHGTVVQQWPQWGVMRATLPLASILSIADRPDVRRMRLPPRVRTN